MTRRLLLVLFVAALTARTARGDDFNADYATCSCGGDRVSSEEARAWSKANGYATTNPNSFCAPTAVTNLDISLGETGGDSPDELQKKLTECLKGNGFLNDCGVCSIIDNERNASLICDCNEKVRNKKFKCRGWDIDSSSEGALDELTDALADGCAAVCMEHWSDGSGHVVTVTGATDDSITIVEPNGGSYTLSVDPANGQVGKPDEPYMKRLAAAGLSNVTIKLTGCVVKCLPGQANFLNFHSQNGGSLHFSQ